MIIPYVTATVTKIRFVGAAMLVFHSCFFSRNIKLRDLPLSTATVSLQYLPRCLRSTVTCGKTPTTVTWSEPFKICCRVIVITKLLASLATCLCRQSSGHEWTAKLITACHKQWSFITACHQNRLLCSVCVIAANELSMQELNRLTLSDGIILQRQETV